jgi:hypothetical protein
VVVPLPSLRGSTPSIQKFPRMPYSSSSMHDPWRLLHDPWRLLHDPWRLLRDPWRLVRDPWRLVRDPWRLLRDPLEGRARPLEGRARPLEALARSLEARARPLEACPRRLTPDRMTRRALASLRNPFAPLARIWRLDYALDTITEDAIVLVATRRRSDSPRRSAGGGLQSPGSSRPCLPS